MMRYISGYVKDFMFFVGVIIFLDIRFFRLFIIIRFWIFVNVVFFDYSYFLVRDR